MKRRDGEGALLISHLSISPFLLAGRGTGLVRLKKGTGYFSSFTQKRKLEGKEKDAKKLNFFDAVAFDAFCLDWI